MVPFFFTFKNDGNKNIFEKPFRKPFYCLFVFKIIKLLKVLRVSLSVKNNKIISIKTKS